MRLCGEELALEKEKEENEEFQKISRGKIS